MQAALRSLTRTNNEKFRAYDRYGTTLAGGEWLPLSVDKKIDKEVYLIRFQPGSRSHPHIHRGSEEFLVLIGTLMDEDGTVFFPGDFVRFEPDSNQSSYSKDGCTLLVILSGGTNQSISTNRRASGFSQAGNPAIVGLSVDTQSAGCDGMLTPDLQLVLLWYSHSASA